MDTYRHTHPHFSSQVLGNTFNLNTAISVMRVLRRAQFALSTRCEVDQITRAHLKSKYKLSNTDIEGLLNPPYDHMHVPMKS